MKLFGYLNKTEMGFPQNEREIGPTSTLAKMKGDLWCDMWV